MNINKPLPGLLDDPQFQITDLPALTDFHIAPLRNPAPTRHGNVPSPLEPVTGNAISNTHGSRPVTKSEHSSEKKRTPKITPNDVLQAREAKKPHIAISELLEATDDPDIIPNQLPSFISLSVVEKSPVQAPSPLDLSHISKRARLDHEPDHVSHGSTRQLPRPAQKDGRQPRPAPLLPAMVTGLHEPPPSAALLPSMDIEVRPSLARSSSSKIQVKDILVDPDVNTSTTTASSAQTLLQKPMHNSGDSSDALPSLVSSSTTKPTDRSHTAQCSKDSKARRVRRKWSDQETDHLLGGVKKYGIGKWKQILDDPNFTFIDRSSVDLKDRYRVCSKDEGLPKHDLEFLTSSAATFALTSEEPNSENEPKHSTSSNPRIDSSTVTNSSTLVRTPSNQISLDQKQRRKRRAWTAVEDEALLQGVAKHGFQWTIIHDDPELDLQHRRATDLRDRIRNRFPEGYKHAESAPLRSEVKKAEKLGSKTPPSRNNSRYIVPKAISKTGDAARPGYMLEVDKERESFGVTLPSLTLDYDEMDWEDKRLPPLLEWDEIGM